MQVQRLLVALVVVAPRFLELISDLVDEFGWRRFDLAEDVQVVFFQDVHVLSVFLDQVRV